MTDSIDDYLATLLAGRFARRPQAFDEGTDPTHREPPTLATPGSAR